MNKFKRFVSLALVLCMVMAFIPVGASAAEDASYAYNIVHVDAGRKYFSVDSLKTIIDNAAEAGFNQVELYLSDNQGFRFALDDMKLTTEYGTYDLTPALGDGYSDGSKYPDYSGKWLTQSEMDEIIAYANDISIDIVPCINVPGHMGAILEVFPEFKYSGSNSSIDLANEEAVAFALALTEKYAAYFASKGCKFYNVGADEYANDMSYMGFEGMGSALYTKFVEFLNDAADIVIGLGMTPRAFNDGFYYKDYSISVEPNKAYEVCYWSSGWSGYDVAAASTIAAKGHKMINTNGEYYWILGDSNYKCSVSKAAQFDETVFSGSTVSDPAGSMFCIWCDVANADGADGGTAVVADSADVIKAFGGALPQVESLVETQDDGVVSEPVETEPPVSSAAPVATENRTITVSVGGTVTDTITGGEYTADETELDKTIATVSVATTPAVEATVKYTQTSVTCRNLLNSNSTYAATGYYYEKNGSYYPLYASRTSRSSWGSTTYTYTWYYSTDNGSTFEQIGTQSVTNTSNVANITVYEKTSTEAVEASTAVTFNGVKIGTTYVTVGNVRYTINVVEEDLNAVTPLTVEYWITNAKLTDSETGLNYLQISAADAGVHSESGIAFTALVPGEIFESRTREYWQVRLLDVLEENASSSGTEHQTMGPGDDETTSGDAITHVRYWKGKWQGLAGTTWLDIDTSTVSAKYMDTNESVSYANRSRHQLVAYYMEVVDIQNANGTTELHINASDWGKKGDGSAADDYLDPNYYCSISLQIVYEDGSTNPASADATNLRGKTIVFGYWTEGRGIGTLNLDGLDQFQIYKVTAETGSVSASFGNGAWGSVTVNSLSWDDNEKTVWEDTPTQKASISNNAKRPDSTDPKDNLMWNENKEAILIRVYVKALQTQDALNVHYIDSSANDLEFYNYSIAVAADKTFDSGFAMGAEKNTLVNNSVINYYGTTQTVSADLATMPQIKAYYRYCTYTLVKAELKNGGKDAYLYYTFTPVVSFVADFGLPLKITPSDLNQDAYADASDVKGVKVIGTYDTEAGITANSEYGVLAVDSSFTVTYTPDEVLQGVDFFTIYVLTALDDPSTNVTNEETGIAYRVYIFPATTVLYEESFITTTGGTWQSNGTANTGAQETEKAGAKSVNYGWTAGYNAEGMTGGTELVSKAAAGTAEFTFTGTGVDIYANCDTDSGIVSVQLQAKNAAGEWATKRVFMVDTASGKGDTPTTDNQDVLAYSLPIVSVDGLAHDTYRVKLQHSGYGQEYGDVRLDGFRVYGTLNNLSSSAYPTAEQNPNYLELRDAVLTALNITDETGTDQVYSAVENSAVTGLLLSNNGTVDAEDLLKNGPKNELFLWPGESLTFNLGSTKAQIGLKALNGTVTYSITDGTENAAATTGTIRTSADMFYHDLTGTIVITNTDDKEVLSVTKLKLFGAKTLQALTAEDVAYTLSVMGLADVQVARPGAPIANPFVDVPEGSWYFDAVQWAVKEGITNGADATHFLPEALCQRATVVTMLWRAAGSPEPETTVNPFVDVIEGSFFYKAVLWAVENGITNGVDASHFAPFGTCNRAQVVTFLWRANGQPAASAVNPFVDVTEGQWYTEAVLWAVENGVTNGMSEIIFGVDSLCNRAQIVTFLYRAAK